MGEQILGQYAESVTQLYECDSGCGRTRRITVDKARERDSGWPNGWPPTFPETCGPCVCPKGGVFIKI